MTVGSIIWPFFVAPLIGLLLGSFPTAYIVVKLVAGVDPREFGSGSVSTRNTIRAAGLWPWGALTFSVDVIKGMIAAAIVEYLIAPLSGEPGTYTQFYVIICAIAAVAGHCWPVFAQFRGGMGMATAGGCALAIFPFGIVLGLLVLIPLMLIIKHSARASLITGILLAPVFYLFGERGIPVGLAACVGLVLVIRFSSDWNREYKELWLDREIP